MSAKKQKQATYSASAANSKQVAITETKGYYPFKPRWRFAKMEFVSPFGWQKMTGAELEVIKKALADLEQLTWRKIFQERADLHHYCPVKGFSKAARQRLRENQLDDMDAVLRLRITAKKRLWGILDSEGVFDILWWDPEHQVYPYEKPNT